LAATEPEQKPRASTVSAQKTDVETSDVRGPDGRKPRRKVSVRALVVLVLVALAVYGFDQLAKFLIVKNSGAAFSLASGSTWIFSIAAAAVTVFILVFARRIRAFSWAVLFGMLLGGTVGNLTDRLFREPGFGLGHVVDFIQVYGFPAIFNIADSFIVASMGLFIILTLRGTNLDGRRTMHMVPVTSGDEVDPSEGGTQGRG
jgi:signal peptidase II